MSTLPPELFDHIFSLVEDATTLRTCSLVCSPWLSAARDHLFATLRTQEGLPKGCRGIANLACTLEYSSGLGHAVKTLVVDGLRSDLRLPLQSFVTVLSQLPRLQHLTLCNTRIPSSPCHFNVKTRAPRLQSLTLRNVGVYVDDPSNVFRILQLFGTVEELTLEKIWFKYSYDMLAQEVAATLPVPTHLSVTSLVLHGADDRTELLLEVFQNTQIPSALRALHLSFYDITPLVPCLSRFLADPRCELRSLTIDFSRCFPYTFWADKPGLRATRSALEHLLHLAPPALRSLRRFDLHTGNVPRDAAAFWEMGLAVLSALPLSVADIQVHVGKESFGFVVSELVRTLEKFEGLESVGIHGLCEGREVTVKSLEGLLSGSNVDLDSLSRGSPWFVAA